MISRIFGLFAPALVAGFLLSACGAQAQNCTGSPNANTICAGPSSGGGGLPSFRTMVPADLAPFTASGSGAVARTTTSKLQDWVSVTDFGASGSGQNTTGSIAVSSTALTLSSALDFANGQGIRVNHAGNGFPFGQPTACSATVHGTTGATTYSYQVASLDAAGGVGAATAVFTVTTGNATLSGTNFNAISCTAPSGPPTGFAIYRNSVLVGIVFSGTPTFNDYGYGVGALGAPDFLPTAPQASSLADWLITTIASGAGTTSLTLNAAATTSATAQGVFHDDTVAINAALAAAPAIIAKCGTYYVSAQLTVSNSPSSFTGMGPNCTTIQKVSISADLFRFTGGGFNNLEKFLVQTSEYQNGGLVFDFLSGASSTNNRLINVFVNGGANVVQFGSGGGQNILDNFVFNNFNQVGIQWSSGFGGADTVSNGIMGAECLINGNSGFGAGLFIQSANTNFYSNLNISCAQNDIEVQPASGQTISDLEFSHVLADGFQANGISRVSGGSGWTFDGSVSGATALQRIRCTSCWAGTVVGNGFVLLDVHGFSCSSCAAYNNGQNGMQITTSDSVEIVGSQFVHNSTSAPNTFDGINAITNSAKISISSTLVGVNAQFPTGTQEWGVASDSTVTNIALCNNIATGNLTAGYNINGVSAPTCTNQ